MVWRFNVASLNKLLGFVLCLAFLASYVSAQGLKTSSQHSASASPFRVAPSFSLSAAPTSVAVGDLNGDGKLDMVITKKGSGSITVMLGDGAGGFGPGVEYAAGTQPGNLLLADLRGSGRLDVIVSDAATGTVNVLAGNGDGSFGKPVSYAGLANSVAMTLGNFKGNGKTDLAVASARGVAVLAGDGSGGFSAPSSFAVNSLPRSITAASLRNNGHDDLVLANQDGTMTVLLGDGTGRFSALAATRIAAAPLSSVVAGDFNGDGKPDLAITHANSNMLTVLLGRGDGSFQAGAPYLVGNSPASVIATDLKGDGVLDLITANQAANTFSVLMGQGDGSFSPSVDFVAGNAPAAIAAGRFHAGGPADLAIVNGGDATVTLAQGLGNGSFHAALSYRSGLERKSIASGSLAGTGRADLVVADYCGSDSSCASNGSATVFLANADGSYRAGASYSLGSGPVAVALADLNGDKNLDLLALNRKDKSLTVMFGHGDGTFGEAQSYVLSGSPSALFVGSLTDSGRPSVAIASDCGSSTCSQPGTLTLWNSRADGTLSESTSYAVGFSPVSIAGGDLHGSGHFDLVVANACGQDASCKGNGTATVLSGDGTGNLRASAEINIGSAPSSIAIGKLSGSGLDLVVAQGGSNQVAVLHGDGKGGFGAPVGYAVGNAPSSLVIGDFTGSGGLDVAVANFKSSTVSILAGTGNGTLKAAATYPVGTGPQSLASIRTGAGRPSSIVTANGNSGATPMGSDISALLTVTPFGVTTSGTSLTNVPATSTVDETVTLTATVTGGSGTPTGNVIFDTVIGAVTTPLSDCGGATGLALDGTGVASCQTQMLPAGSYSVDAEYQGDPTYAVSTAGRSQTVAPANTTTTLGALPANTVFGQALTLTATVAPSPAATIVSDTLAITTTVAFTDGSNPITGCTAQSVTFNAVTGTASATCSVSSLGVGSHSLVAVYSGDSNYNTSTSSTVTHVVAKASTTTSLNGSSATSNVNQAVTFTATVTATAPGTGTPAGNVNFLDGANPVAGCSNLALNGSGVAACATSSLTGGSHSITAVYLGNTDYNTSTSSATSHTVNASATTTTLSGLPVANTVFGQALTLTATVAPSPAPAVIADTVAITTSVAFMDGATTIASCSAQTVTFDAGTGTASATCSISTLGAGSHSLTAVYSGDSNYSTSTSAALPRTVAKASTTTSLSATTATSNVNQAVTFTATVTATAPSTAVPAGNVNFLDGVNPVAGCSNVALNGSGVATCSISSLVAGSHSITATYLGNSDDNTSTSSATTHTVNTVATATSLSSSTNPSNLNQSVTFTATVSPANGAVALSGTVAFTDNGNSIGACSAVAVNASGVATCTTSTLGSGNHSIVANYGSDSNYGPSSANVTQSVSSTGSSTSLASSANPSSVNQLVTFTATIGPLGGSVGLTGTVTFQDNGGPLGGCTPTFTPATGIATCATSSLSVGSHAIKASYTGDASYTASNATVTQVVNQATTSLALASSANPSSINQSVTFTATITAPAGGKTLTGTVAFTDNTTTTLSGCGAVAPSVTGVATCTISTLSLGSHTIAATYSNDTNFAGSTNSVSQMVNAAASGLTLTTGTANNASTVNQTVIFTATVSGASGSTKFSGTTTFTDNGASICSIAADPTTGVATCSDATLTAGSHTIVATYAGDSNFASSSKTVTQTVSPAVSSVAVTSSLNPSIVVNPMNVSDSVTFTATVKPSSGAVMLSGSVTFTDNGLTIPECPTAVPVVPATGVATCTTKALAAGANTILVAYNGDSNFTASNTSLTQGAQDYTLGASAASASITQGFDNTNDPFSAQTLTITPASISGFSGTVTLTCAVAANSAPAGGTPPTCTLGSSTVTVAGGAAQQSVSFVLAAAANADPGTYTVTLTGVDGTTGLTHSAGAINVNLRSASSVLTVVSGAVTGNTSTVNFVVPANVSLGSFLCVSISGTGISAPAGVAPSTLSVGCSFSPSSVAASATAQTVPVTVTVTTSGVTTASLADETNRFAPILLGIPLAGLIGLLRRRRSFRAALLRGVVALAILAAGMQLSGCGGSFKKPPTVSGLTPPGSYHLLVQSAGSDGNSYQAVVNVNVTR